MKLTELIKMDKTQLSTGMSQQMELLKIVKDYNCDISIIIDTAKQLGEMERDEFLLFFEKIKRK